MPNVARFDAGTVKLQRMIKWDVFWDKVQITALFRDTPAEECTVRPTERELIRDVSQRLSVSLTKVQRPQAVLAKLLNEVLLIAYRTYAAH